MSSFRIPLSLISPLRSSRYGSTLKREIRLFVLVAATAAILLALPQRDAHSSDVYFSDSLSTVTVPVTSMHERTFFQTVKQQFDFSCGSAAVATLLTYHYRQPVTEKEVFFDMYERGNKAKIRKEGFSLLDVKLYLESRGLKADGFKLPLEKVQQIGVPTIVLINDAGYNHFVVLKGISETDILAGDPAKGIRTIPRSEFLRMWNGIVFLIRSRRDIASQHYNTEQEWQAVAKAPVEELMTRESIANLTLLLRGPNEF